MHPWSPLRYRPGESSASTPERLAVLNGKLDIEALEKLSKTRRLGEKNAFRLKMLNNSKREGE